MTIQTRLAQHILETPLCDTHEHLWSEQEFVRQEPDILQTLFSGGYVTADLVVAGASPEDVEALVDSSDPNIGARFQQIERAWKAVQHTGYGEAVRITAQKLYDIDDINSETLEAAQVMHTTYLGPGKRLLLLRDVANLDHVQIDDFTWSCLPDAAGPDFFFSDISWWKFCCGTPEIDLLQEEIGVEVVGLASLRQAMEIIFERFASTAIAVKAQHAYNRTLQWRERNDAEASRALSVYLQKGAEFSTEDSLCLGDWCWARGVELATDYDLPFKIHTGYYAHYGHMQTSYIQSGHLSDLLIKYPDPRFVLMHAAYPYSNELVALAKHFPNVYADLCWAWSIDPYSASDFLRRCIHAVPANKIFAFGGDTRWPGTVVGYAAQARICLTRALQAEIDDGFLSEDDAIALANRFMRDNQYDCFRLDEKRATMQT
ncbi:MAG: amidohydrolase family protein [Chloroflexota bacterium]|nr:amidohydrolase family protein [Chloroflexota bacterium]